MASVIAAPSYKITGIAEMCSKGKRDNKTMTPRSFVHRNTLYSSYTDHDARLTG